MVSRWNLNILDFFSLYFFFLGGLVCVEFQVPGSSGGGATQTYWLHMGRSRHLILHAHADHLYSSGAASLVLSKCISSEKSCRGEKKVNVAFTEAESICQRTSEWRTWSQAMLWTVAIVWNPSPNKAEIITCFLQCLSLQPCWGAYKKMKCTAGPKNVDLCKAMDGFLKPSPQEDMAQVVPYISDSWEHTLNP